MITWTNAPGLAEHIRAAGHRFEEILHYDNTREYRTDDDVAVQALIDAYTVQDARDWLKATIQSHVNNAYERAIINLYGERPHDLESNSWFRKEEAAKAWDAWNLSDKSAPEPDTAVLQPRVTVANPLADEVARVLAKATALHGANDVIQARAQQIKEEIANAGDFTSLNAINFNAGWPV